MTAYYNEHDKFAANWLRNLIAEGHIAPGEVDERDIKDVIPAELSGFTQCHFFAGIGVWSYALRKAGWPDDKPVWTGSCPCQPFSTAGRGEGFVDERHLWPHFFHLIEQRRPDVIYGEQVASSDGLAWLDLVQADMEGTGHTFGALDLCAAGFGAPNIRQRLFWVANADSGQCDGFPSGQECQRNGPPTRRLQGNSKPECGGKTDGVVNAIGEGLEGHAGHGDESHKPGRQRTQPPGSIAASSSAGGVVNTDGGNASTKGQQPSGQQRRQPENGIFDGQGIEGRKYNSDGKLATGPTNGFWRNADWLFSTDGKWRAVEPGTFPLVTGATKRVGRLRGYGNAINPEVAAEFIKASIEAMNETL